MILAQDGSEFASNTSGMVLEALVGHRSHFYVIAGRFEIDLSLTCGSLLLTLLHVQRLSLLPSGTTTQIRIGRSRVWNVKRRHRI